MDFTPPLVQQPTSGSPGNWGFVMYYGRPVRVGPGDEIVTEVTALGDQTRQYITSGSLIYQPPTPFDEAQRLQWEQNARRAEERYKQELEAQRLAEERSMALLCEFMSPAQRDQYRMSPEFIVVAKSGRRYRIRPGLQVTELGSGGQAIMNYCISPNAKLPHGDVMLAQKLMLENNEAEFHKIANAFTVTGRRIV